MPAVPVMSVMPVAIVADPARAVIGPDHPAAVMIIGIIGRIVAAMEEATVVDVCEANTAAMPAATAMPAPSSMPTYTMPAATVTPSVSASMASSVPASMSAANLDHSVTGSLRKRSAWRHQRCCLRAIACGERNRQHRSGGERKSAHKFRRRWCCHPCVLPRVRTLDASGREPSSVHACGASGARLLHRPRMRLEVTN